MGKISKGLISGIAVFLLLVVSFCFFSVRVDYLTEKNIKQEMAITADNNATSIKSMFGKDLQCLNAISAQLTQNNKELNAETAEYLHPFAENGGYMRMAIDLPDGTCYSSDGKTIESVKDGYYPGAMSEKDELESIYKSEIDNISCISLVVPISENGKVIGALRGIYDSSVLQDSLDLNIFDGHGYFNLVDKEGKFLFKPAKGHSAYNQKNIFTVLQKADFRSGYSLASLKKDMLKGEHGVSVYSLLDEERFVYYEPVGIDDWYIVTVVPDDYFLPQKQMIDGTVLVLLIFLVGLFSGLAYYIYYQGNKLQTSLKRERDYFNSILNNIPLPVFITDSHMILEFVNEAALGLFHKKYADLIGKPCKSCETKICGTSDCAIEKMISTGMDSTLLEANSKYYMVNTAALDKGDMDKGGYIEVFQNISDIVEMQKSLEEKSLELETISQNLVGGVLITGLEKGFPIIRCNQGYCDLIGSPGENLKGKSALDGVAHDDRETVEKTIYEKLNYDNFISQEHKLLKSNGEEIWVILYGKKSILHGEDVGIWLLMDISESKEIETALKVSEERYRIAMDNTEDIIIEYNFETKVIHHAHKVTELYDIPQSVANAPEGIINAGVIGETSKETFLKMFVDMNSGAPKVSGVIKTIGSGKRTLWNRLTFTTIFDIEGKPVRAIGIMQDITGEVEAKRQYEREAQYRKIMGEDATLYYEADLTNHCFVTGHEEIVSAYGKKGENDYDTVTGLLLDNVVYKDDRILVQSHISQEYLTENYKKGNYKITFEHRQNTGAPQPLWVECTIFLMTDETTKDIRLLCYIKDINDVKIRELDLQHKAERDLLTGLYNKVTTENLVDKNLSFQIAKEGSSAFFLIDLDDFKNINDTLGHAFGDAVLSEISQRLEALFNVGDVVGRIGGDEFVAFIPGPLDEEAIINWGIKICDMFKGVYTGSDMRYKVSGSVGIAISPQHGKTFGQLYPKADVALYYAKNLGKDTFRVYNEEMPPMQPGIGTGLRGIDKNFGKVFSKNIVEYVVRILYEAAEPLVVINAILELVAKHFCYSCSYVFERIDDGNLWHNTFQWCAGGIPSRNTSDRVILDISMTEDASRFNKEGIFIAEKVADIPQPLRSTMESLGTKSTIQFAIISGGKISALLGFDDCVQERTPSESEVSVLHMIAMILGPYLHK
ncbi:MAG: diguanylate cyclase [Clostridiales bacterium]